jgi:secreted Zn-dependent insulinase-like peptidase
LGYVVFSRDFGVRNAIGCQFLVQSPEKSNEYIVNSLNNWLLTMKKEINEISEEDFKKTVGAV